MSIVKTIKNKVIPIITIFIISGCNMPLEKNNPKEILVYWNFKTNEFAPSPLKYKLSKSDKFLDPIITQISEKKIWVPSIVSYVPKILIKSDLYSINITEHIDNS